MRARHGIWAAAASLTFCSPAKAGALDINRGGCRQGSGLRRSTCARDLARFFGLAVELDVILQPHPRDHVELALERVDMLFLAGEDVDEEFAADEIADRLAMRDRFLEHRDRLDFDGEVGAEDLLDGLADAQPAKQLEIRKAF